MFPLSPTFLILLPFLGFFVLSSLCIALISRRLVFGLIPLLIIVVAEGLTWVWVENSSDEYAWVALYTIGVALLVTFVISVVWGVAMMFILKRATSRMVNHGRNVSRLLVFLAFLPALVIGLVRFEAQYITDSRCSEESVTYKVGGQNYTVGIEFSPRIETDYSLGISPAYFLANVLDGGDYELHAFHYSNRARDKEDLKKICNKTEGGNLALPTEIVWITPASIYDEIDTLCHSSSGDIPKYCAKYSPELYKDIASIKLTHRDLSTEGYPALRKQRLSSVHDNSGGDLDNGYWCSGGEEGPYSSVGCEVWRKIDEDVILTADTHYLKEGNRAEILKTLNEAVDFTLEAFAE